MWFVTLITSVTSPTSLLQHNYAAHVFWALWTNGLVDPCEKAKKHLLNSTTEYNSWLPRQNACTLLCRCPHPQGSLPIVENYWRQNNVDNVLKHKTHHHHNNYRNCFDIRKEPKEFVLLIPLSVRVRYVPSWRLHSRLQGHHYRLLWYIRQWQHSPRTCTKCVPGTNTTWLVFKRH